MPQMAPILWLMSLLLFILLIYSLLSYLYFLRHAYSFGGPMKTGLTPKLNWKW
uniref:ATP synthase F0 subunit 8 n=1 Tax=Pseudoniphargus sp. 2-Canaries TaxID=2212670 RepID=A0A345UE83_9CRUS|nr:ATP synthase F0 subunit 8 [Pseudoniphargus sp. 2-Canaries]